MNITCYILLKIINYNVMRVHNAIVIIIIYWTLNTQNLMDFLQRFQIVFSQGHI